MEGDICEDKLMNYYMCMYVRKGKEVFKFDNVW